jgi:hypothetical protein
MDANTEETGREREQEKFVTGVSRETTATQPVFDETTL